MSNFLDFFRSIRSADAHPALLSSIRCSSICRKLLIQGGGLKAQHLAGVQLVSRVFSGRLEGDCVGSTTLGYVPRGCTVGAYTADINTAVCNVWTRDSLV